MPSWAIFSFSILDAIISSLAVSLPVLASALLHGVGILEQELSSSAAVSMAVPPITLRVVVFEIVIMNVSFLIFLKFYTLLELVGITDNLV